MRPINKIFIHVSDSRDDLDVGVKEIRQWHLARGWKDIGYHYVVRIDGTVEPGRPEEKIGAHAQGYNEDSIGVCWVGRFAMHPKQKESLVRLVKSLMKKYKLSRKDVLGHYEVDTHGKTCPNINMDEFRDLLKSEACATVSNGQGEKDNETKPV